MIYWNGNRTHWMLSAIYLGLSMLIISLGNSLGDTIFEKNSSEGRPIKVVQTTYKKHIVPTAEYQQSLTSGLVAVESDVRLTDCLIFFKNTDGTETVAWQRTFAQPLIPCAPQLLSPFRVLDVAEKNGFLAILYSAEKIEIDVIDLNAEEGHNILAHESLFRNSCLAILKQGKLVWLDKLYVILEFDPEATEVFCIDKGKCKKLFTDSKIEYSK